MSDYKTFDLIINEAAKTIQIKVTPGAPFSTQELAEILGDIPENYHLQVFPVTPISEADIDLLLQALAKNKRRLMISFPENTAEADYNPIFSDYFAYACRKKPLVASPIADLSALITPPKQPSKLRRAKQLMMEGKKIEASQQQAVHHHQQVQQEAVEEQQQEQAQEQFQTRQTQVEQQQARMANYQQNQAQEVDIASFGKLIHRGNLADMVTPDWELAGLEQMWDQFVGEYAEKVANPNYRITHIPADTFLLMLEHHEQFSGGVCFHNLPNGFGFVATKEPELSILYHKSELEKDNEQRTDSFLAPQIIEYTSQTVGIKKSVAVFYPFFESNEVTVKSITAFKDQHAESFAKVYDRRYLLTLNRIEAKEALVNLLILDAPHLVGQQKILEATLVNNTLRLFLPAFSDLLLEAEAEHVVFILTKQASLPPFTSLDYLETKTLLLRAPQRPNELDIYSALDYLVNMRPPERVWWDALFAQHKHNNFFFDIVDLVNAHAYFFKKTNELQLELPLPCPIQNSKNLKTTYDRLLYVFEHAINPSEQLKYLENLDWDVQGAYLAALEGLLLCTEDMRLTPKQQLVDLTKYQHLLPQRGPWGKEGLFGRNPWKLAENNKSAAKNILDTAYQKKLIYSAQAPHGMAYTRQYTWPHNRSWTVISVLDKAPDGALGIVTLELEYVEGLRKKCVYPITDIQIQDACLTTSSNLSYHTGFKQLVHLADKVNQYQNLIPETYRAIAREHYAFEFETYKKIFSALSLSTLSAHTEHNNKFKKALQPLLTFTTTGLRALKDNQDLHQTTTTLFALIQSASHSMLNPQSNTKKYFRHYYYHYSLRDQPDEPKAGEFVIGYFFVLRDLIKEHRLDDAMYNDFSLAMFQKTSKGYISIPLQSHSAIEALCQLLLRLPDSIDDPSELYGTNLEGKPIAEAQAELEAQLLQELSRLGYLDDVDIDKTPNLQVLKQLKQINQQLIDTPVRPLLSEVTGLLRLKPNEAIIELVFELVKAQGEYVYLALDTLSQHLELASHDALLAYFTDFKANTELSVLQKNALLLLSRFLPSRAWPDISSLNLNLAPAILESLIDLLETARLNQAKDLISMASIQGLLQSLATLNSSDAQLKDKIEHFTTKHLSSLRFNDVSLAKSMVSLLQMMLPFVDELEKLAGQALEIPEAYRDTVQGLDGLIKAVQAKLLQKVTPLATSLRAFANDNLKSPKGLLNELQDLVNAIENPLKDIAMPEGMSALTFIGAKLAVNAALAVIKPLLFTQLSHLIEDTIKAEIKQQVIDLNIQDTLLAEPDTKLSSQLDSFLSSAIPSLDVNHLVESINTAFAMKDKVDSFVNSLNHWRPQKLRDLLLVNLYRQGYLSSKLPFALDEMADFFTLLKTTTYNPSAVILALFAAKSEHANYKKLAASLRRLMDATLSEPLVLGLLSLAGASAEGDEVVKSLLSLKNTLQEKTFIQLYDFVMTSPQNPEAAPLAELAKLADNQSLHLDALLRYSLHHKMTLTSLLPLLKEKDDFCFALLNGACWQKSALVSVDEQINFIASLKPQSEPLKQALKARYQYQPSPNFKILQEAIANAKDEAAIFKWLHDIELDPFGHRSKILPQYKLKAAQDYLVTVTLAQSGEKLAEAQQGILLDAYTYVMGVSATFKRKTQTDFKPFNAFTRDELTAYYQTAITKADDPNAKLEVIAILCEVWFRTSGQYPFPPQLFAILSTVCFPHNAFLEIPTGQGKSLVNAVLAAFHFAFPPKPGTFVGVFSNNILNAERDYQDSKPFFAYLDITTKLLQATTKADSTDHLYQKPAIYFSTIGDKALYDAALKVVHQVKAPPPALQLALLDEGDILFDADIDFNFSDSREDPFINPIEWAYPLANAFIQESTFLNLNVFENEDIYLFRSYLKTKAPEAYAKAFKLDKLTDFKLSRLINAACTAKTLKENEDFILGTTERMVHGKIDISAKAILLAHHFANPDATLSDGVQQCLHAHLNQKYAADIQEGKKLRFAIDNEIYCVDSQTFHTCLLGFGHLILTTATPGSTEEINEACHRYNIPACLAFPPRSKKKLSILPTRFSGENRFLFSQETQIKVILSVIKKHLRQPILLVAKDIETAEQFYQALAPLYQTKVQIVHAKHAIDPKAFKAAIDKASRTSQITIVTPLAGRGVDIKFDEALTTLQKKLLVILTMPARARIEKQIYGRTARGDNPGEIIGIFDISDLLPKGSGKYSRKEKLALLKSLSRKLDKEASIERSIKIQLKAQQTPFEQAFDDALFQLTPASQERDKILEQKAQFLLKTKEQWQERLAQSDPKGEFPNPYIRYDENGVLQENPLDQTLATFKTDLEADFEEAMPHVVIPDAQPKKAEKTTAPTAPRQKPSAKPKPSTATEEETLTQVFVNHQASANDAYSENIRLEKDIQNHLDFWIKNNPKASKALKALNATFTTCRVKTLNPNEPHALTTLNRLNDLVKTTKPDTFRQLLDFQALSYQDFWKKTAPQTIIPEALQASAKALRANIQQKFGKKASKITQSLDLLLHNVQPKTNNHADYLGRINAILEKLEARSKKAGWWKDKNVYTKKIAALTQYRDSILEKQPENLVLEAYSLKLRAKFDPNLYQSSAKFFKPLSRITTTHELNQLADEIIKENGLKK